MNHSTKQQVQLTTEMCADIVDVLSDSVNNDALHTLISVFLELSGLPLGNAFTTDMSSQIEHSLALQLHAEVFENVPFEYPTPLAFRSLTTLQPEFSVTSSQSGLCYDYSFPLRTRGEALGAISLRGAHSQLLGEHAISTLQSIADIAATSIDQTRQLQQNRLLVNQLQNALNSRVVLEQAKGVLAERMKVDFPSAFAELRSLARNAQRPIHHVAEDIVSTITQQAPVPATLTVA